MGTNIFVAGFPYELTQEELAKIFSAHGNVVSTKILVDRETGRSRGLGFVAMATEAEAQAAISKLNDSVVGHRRIMVSEARPQDKAAVYTGPERRSGKDRRRAPAAAPADRRFEKKPWDKDRKPAFGDKKPWDKKPWDKDRKPAFGDKKPWDKKPWDKDRKPGFGDKKPWEKKPWDEGKKPGFGDRKPWDKDRKPGFPAKKKWGAGGPNSGRKPGDFMRKPGYLKRKSAGFRRK
jgi:RNA recognition motif-containing protein